MKEAVSRKNRLLRRWIRIRNITNRAAYIEASNEAEHRKEAKKQLWKEICE